MTMFMACFRFTIRFLLLALTSQFGCPAFADEVILDNQTNSQLMVGDFNCSTCAEQVTTSISLFGHNNQTRLTAGQLWQFFNNQGVDSLDKLTLCLDVGELDSQSKFDVQSIQFRIEDTLASGNFLTNVSLGNNTLVVPGSMTSSSKPEAKLEILLDYDFMQRFSANSSELITLDFSSNGELASEASISIEGNGNVFTKSNLLLLFGFISFWFVVFTVLNRVTKPLSENPDPVKTNPVMLASQLNPANSSNESIGLKKHSADRDSIIRVERIRGV